MNRGYIGGVLVKSNYPFIVYGSVRGLVSQHRSGKVAVRSCNRDWVGCRKQGGYSDAAVYEYRNDRWDPIGSGEYDLFWGA